MESNTTATRVPQVPTLTIRVRREGDQFVGRWLVDSAAECGLPGTTFEDAIDNAFNSAWNRAIEAKRGRTPRWRHMLRNVIFSRQIRLVIEVEPMPFSAIRPIRRNKAEPPTTVSRLETTRSDGIH